MLLFKNLHAIKRNVTNVLVASIDNFQTSFASIGYYSELFSIYIQLL